MAHSPTELFEVLFHEKQHLLKDIISTAIAYKTVTVEGYGQFFLDRDVEQAEIDFMKSISLVDIEFVLPAEGSDQATFIIQNKSDPSQQMVCSNRFSSKGELRGKVLRDALLNKTVENEKQSLYEAMTLTIHSDFKQSTEFLYLMGALPFDKEHKALILSLSNTIIDNLPEHPTDLSELPQEEQTKALANYAKQIKPVFLSAFGIELATEPTRPSAPNSRAGIIPRNLKTFLMGMACLALVLTGLALSATGFLAATGIPLLISSAVIAGSFVAGSSCAGSMVYDQVQHKQAWNNYQEEYNTYQQALYDNETQIINKLSAQSNEVIDSDEDEQFDLSSEGSLSNIDPDEISNALDESSYEVIMHKPEMHSVQQTKPKEVMSTVLLDHPIQDTKGLNDEVDAEEEVRSSPRNF